MGHYDDHEWEKVQQRMNKTLEQPLPRSHLSDAGASEIKLPMWDDFNTVADEQTRQWQKDWEEWTDKVAKENDLVNHPLHYCEHPSGIECIQITEHMNFCVGNAVKYLFRAGLKNKDAKEDLRKASWYINREIERLTAWDEEV